MPSNDSNWLYVGNLAYSVDWMHLKDLFRDAGIDVKHVHIMRDDVTTASKGCALVEVANEDEARLAREKLHDREVGDPPRKIFVREDRDAGKAKGKGSSGSKGSRLPMITDGRPTSSSTRGDRSHAHSDGKNSGTSRHVYLENLPSFMNWWRIKDLCKDRGLNPKHADVVNARPGASSCSALVEFNSPSDVKEAIRMLDDLEVSGKRIVAKEDRESGGGGGSGAASAKKRTREEMVRAERPQGPQAQRRLMAENLSSSVDWKALKDFFRSRFRVEYADVLENDDGVFGVVEFSTRQEAMEACMELNGADLEGKPIRLRQDRGEFKDMRSSQNSDQARHESDGSRSRSRSRSSSKSRAVKRQRKSPSRDRPKSKSTDSRSSKKSRSRSRKAKKEKSRSRSRTGSNGDRDCQSSDDDSRNSVKRSRRPPKHPPVSVRARQRDSDDKKDDPRHRGGTKNSGGNRVYVGNLAYNTTWQTLKDHFRKIGTVAYSNVLQDPTTKRSKGCGIVEFETDREAKKAIEKLHDSELDGRLIFVREDRE